MRTSKPIATISYNTPEYLKLKLEELRKAGRLSEWYFIHHKAEADEKKDHIHLYAVPSKMLQTDDLTKEFLQPDPAKPGMFVTCPRWVSSKFADWYLYAIHDPAYLASKGQTRQYHYRLEDVQAYDRDALEECVREIDLTTLNAVKRMQDAQKAGLSYAQFFRSGGVPINAVRAYQEAWKLLQLSGIYRNGREGHEEAETAPPVSVDPVTGEFAEEPQAATHMPQEPTWCGATHNEWKELYESAESDSEQIDPFDSGWTVIDPDGDDELPF